MLRESYMWDYVNNQRQGVKERAGATNLSLNDRLKGQSQGNFKKDGFCRKTRSRLHLRLDMMNQSV